MKKFGLIFITIAALVLSGCVTTGKDNPAKPQTESPADQTPTTGTAQDQQTPSAGKDTSKPSKDDKTTAKPSKDDPKKTDGDSQEKTSGKTPKADDKTEGQGQEDTKEQSDGANSLSDAQKKAGFKIDTPKTLLTSFTGSEYSVVEKTIIQVKYSDPAKKDDYVIVRKGLGNLDVSGDFGTYRFTKFFTSNGIRVLARGTADGYNIISWTSGDYSFSVNSSVPLNEIELMEIVKQIN